MRLLLSLKSFAFKRKSSLLALKLFEMEDQYSWDMSYMTKMALVQDMIVGTGMYKGNFVVASTKEPRAPPTHPSGYPRNPKALAVPSQLEGACLSLLPPVRPSVRTPSSQPWVGCTVVGIIIASKIIVLDLVFFSRAFSGWRWFWSC